MSQLNLLKNDPYLEPYSEVIIRRHQLIQNKKKEISGSANQLADFANGHHYFGCIKGPQSWTLREWAPNASSICLTGTRMGWENPGKDYEFTKKEAGQWELVLPLDKMVHLDEYKLLVRWPGGSGYRLSPWSRWVIQDPETKLFNQQVWDPKNSYEWKNSRPQHQPNVPRLIYEAHVGMSSEATSVSTYLEFARDILPKIADLGYTTVQLMAIQEHPYYGSFGYHVSNFFAVSSRFGSPEDLKFLIDTAHGLGLQVIMDLVHSHAVKNILEGPGLFDGTPGMFFHTDYRREHPAWDSLCFDYGKNETLHFLLSNCKYWLEEFHFDGFRFDGVTSMLYQDHGLEKSFSSYEHYFNPGVDEDALVCLALSNCLIQELHPDNISIAEDMSGMPGLASKIEDGGIGFSYRLAMGIPDFWIRMIKDRKDEDWNVNEIFHELTNRRIGEPVISYAESHDQALVGDKTLIFRLADQEMYFNMSIQTPSIIVDRAMALHKMIRLITLSTHGGGYLNFMGNEFGHPEWIDFPRQGNNWSFQYARRQWNLVTDSLLKYQFLNNFDRAMIQFFKSADGINRSIPERIFAHEGDQVLAFRRADYLVIFNFHPSQSYANYGIPCEPADYKIILSTDSPHFGGFDRIKTSIDLEAYPVAPRSSNYQVMTYLPSRTALLIKSIPTPGVR